LMNIMCSIKVYYLNLMKIQPTKNKKYNNI